MIHVKCTKCETWWTRSSSQADAATRRSVCCNAKVEVGAGEGYLPQ